MLHLSVFVLLNSHPDYDTCLDGMDGSSIIESARDFHWTIIMRSVLADEWRRVTVEHPAIGDFDFVADCFLGLLVDVLDPVSELLRIGESGGDPIQNGFVVTGLDKLLGNLPEFEKPVVIGDDLTVFIDHEITIENGLFPRLEQ